MADFEDLVELVSAVDALETGSAEWTAARRDAVNGIARQCERCAKWLEPGRFLLAEAIGHSEAHGNLVKLAQRLDAVGSTDAPAGEDQDVVPGEHIELLNQAYVLYRRADSRLRSYRKATITRRSLGTRIARLSRLCADQDARAWQAPLAELVRASDEGLKNEFERMARQGRAEELKHIEEGLSNIVEDDPRIDKALKVVRSVRARANDRASDRRRIRLLEQLHAAHSSQDQSEARELLAEIDGISEGSAATTEQTALIDDVRNWLEREQSSANRVIDFNRHINALERALDDGASRADLERLHAALMKFDELIPENLEARYQSQLASTEQTERSKRRLLATAASITIVAGLVATLFFANSWRKEAAVTTAANEVIVLVDSGSLEQARERLDELMAANEGSRNVELGNAIAELDAAIARRNEVDGSLRLLLDTHGPLAEDGGDDVALGEAVAALDGVITEGGTPDLAQEVALLSQTLEEKRSRIIGERMTTNRNAVNEVVQIMQSISARWDETKNAPDFRERLRVVTGMIPETQQVVTDAESVLESTELDAALRSAAEETLADARRLNETLLEEEAELKPGLATLKAVETATDELEFAAQLANMVDEHGALLLNVHPTISVTDWETTVAAAQAGAVVLNWRERIKPILDGAPGGNPARLPDKDLEQLNEQAYELSKIAGNGPLREFLAILTVLRPAGAAIRNAKRLTPDQGDVKNQRNPELDFVGRLWITGLSDLHTATVIETDPDGKRVERKLLGHGESANTKKIPFKYWVQRPNEIGSNNSRLAKGDRAVDNTTGPIIYKARQSPGLWSMSSTIGSGIESIPTAMSRFHAQQAALELLEAIRQGPEPPEARFWILCQLWRIYANTFHWPDGEGDAINAEIDDVMRRSSEAVRYDWVTAWSEDDEDPGAIQAAREGLERFPDIKTLKARMQSELDRLAGVNQHVRTTGILGPGTKGSVREAIRATDGTHHVLAWTQKGNNRDWNLVRIEVEDGRAVNLPEGVPNGYLILYGNNESKGSN